MSLKTLKTDLAIIGGGPAGMSAAVAAYDAGVRNLLILERDGALGGILQQCIHNGFGLHRFGEELSGPEYAHRYEEMVRQRNIPFKLNTMVLDLTQDRRITATNSEDGVFYVDAGAVILAMGCRERPRGALNTPGTRPAGIYTAGTAQKLVNVKGCMPGRDVVILGSGDIGLIMARRMTLEGARVHAVCELMPYSGGLARNIEQCLHDFDIPLYLSTTVVGIKGRERLESVQIASVDENRRPIPSTIREIPCDTLLLSVGLIPENELTKSAGVPLDRTTQGAVVDQDRMTRVPGIFSCGNVLHVHDLVDYVSDEAAVAGRAAAAYLSGLEPGKEEIEIVPDGLVRYTVPQRLTRREQTRIFFRVGGIYRNVRIVVRDGEREIYSAKKLKVAPGEMESITLSKDVMRTLSGGRLEIGLEETP
ncbi:MAG: FAD-dependent oxidoreductase [Clostridia bacterium]|nr:FAD-dependent oxidoreductase [Clostridia bacterium]